MNTEEKLQKAINFINDIVEHGTRHDLNPTMILGRGEEHAHVFWANWCKSMEKSIQDRAKDVLKQIK
jgi:hypothetical protein